MESHQESPQPAATRFDGEGSRHSNSAHRDEPFPVNVASESSARRLVPHLSTRGLTSILLLMCLAPIATIFGLWIYLPPVAEGKLECVVIPLSLPPGSIYLVPYRERPAYPNASILVRNESDDEWTHLNVMINKHYQIYDIEPLRPGEERVYLLDRFIGRTGARFEIRYNPLRNVRVYARRPAGDRATHYETLSAPAETVGDASEHG